MTNEGTAIEKAIVRLMTEIDECAGGDTRARSIYKKSIGILQSMLPVEKEQLEQAYEEGTKYESERLDFEDYYNSIKLNK